MVFRQMSLQIACLRWGIVTVITFVWLFSTMCPHTFLHSAFSNVSSICLPRKRHSHIGCICLAFLHCAFSNVYSNCFSEKRQSHICCICLVSLHCGFSDVSSNVLPVKRHSHIGCICWTFLHCVFSNVPSNNLPERMYGLPCLFPHSLFLLPLDLLHWLCFVAEDFDPSRASCIVSCRKSCSKLRENRDKKMYLHGEETKRNVRFIKSLQFFESTDRLLSYKLIFNCPETAL